MKALNTPLVYDNCKGCDRIHCEHYGKDREFVCPGGKTCKETAKEVSVFTEHIEELTKYIRHTDTLEVSGNEFIRLQRMEARINQARDIGYYDGVKARTVIALYVVAMNDYREALRAIGEIH